jgi:nucleoid-associated protein YgaU
MTRENKLALIIGFGVLLLVGVLLSDHFSAATGDQLADLTNQPMQIAHAIQDLDVRAVDPLADTTHNQPAPRSRSRYVAEREELRPHASDRPADEFMVIEPPADPQPSVFLDPAPEDTTTRAGSPNLGSRTWGDSFRDAIESMTRGSEPVTTAPTVESPREAEARSNPAPPARFVTHTTTKSDTLTALARRYYGDGERWRDIHEANEKLIPNPDRLPLGVELIIPGVASDPVPTRRDDRNRRDRTYEIRPGDVLSVVAQRTTGSARNTEALYQANRDVIRDKDMLVPGTVIRIPVELALRQ